MFDYTDKPLLMGNGCFPPEKEEKPRFTVQEDLLHTAREMRQTIDRLLKFEQRTKQDFEDLMRTLTSDNVLFKTSMNEAHTLFLTEVKNEINMFEANVSSSISLFQKDIETNYASLSSDVRTAIAENLASMVADFEAFKTQIDNQYNAFAENVNTRIEQNNQTHSQAMADYQRHLTTELNTFEQTITANFDNFVDGVNCTINTFKDTWETIITERLNTQDAKLSDAEMYMKTNLTATVTTLIGDMADNGDFVDIIEGEVFNHLQSQLGDFVNVKSFGAKGDGVTDDTDAINLALRSGAKHVYFPKATYLLSPSNFTENEGYSTLVGLSIPDGVKLYGCGSTIKIANDDFEKTIVIFATDKYKSVSYEEGIERVSGISIFDFIVDGNIANIHKENSITGIAIYKADNVTINNVVMKNLFGTDGTGYGVIFAYSNNCIFTNSIIERSSRSNIYCWESQNVKCENLYLYGSTYRDCVTCGSENNLSLQKSEIVFNNCTMKHNFTSGTHVARFTGHVVGVLENCVIIGNGNIDGVASPRSDNGAIDLTIRNCKISNCTVGVNVTGSNDYSRFIIENCDIQGVKSLRIDVSDELLLSNNKLTSTDNTTNLSIISDKINVVDNQFENNTHVTFSIPNIAMIERNVFKNMSGENVVICSGEGCIIFIGNITETLQTKVRIYTKGIATGNYCAIDSTSVNTQ